MDPIPIPKQAAEKMKDDPPPSESAVPVPRQPPLAEKILRATQDAEDVPTSAASAAAARAATCD